MFPPDHKVTSITPSVTQNPFNFNAVTASPSNDTSLISLLLFRAVEIFCLKHVLQDITRISRSNRAS